LLRFLNKLKYIFFKAIYFIFTRFFVLLVGAIGYYYNYTLFTSLTKDTTSITNGAFVIMASISSLSFSCARAIEGPPEHKDRFAYAGERFFHSSIMVLCASIIKYTLLSIKSSNLPQLANYFIKPIDYVFGIIIGVLFFYSITSIHGGLIILNKLLWSRLNRYPEWDQWL
jgi:hypothetical protein